MKERSPPSTPSSAWENPRTVEDRLRFRQFVTIGRRHSTLSLFVPTLFYGFLQACCSVMFSYEPRPPLGAQSVPFFTVYYSFPSLFFHRGLPGIFWQSVDALPSLLCCPRLHLIFIGVLTQCFFPLCQTYRNCPM